MAGKTKFTDKMRTKAAIDICKDKNNLAYFSIYTAGSYGIVFYSTGSGSINQPKRRSG
jgi:hypothetical protein